MPKAGTNLTPDDIKKVRKVHNDVLDKNTALKATITDELKGLKGKKRSKAWGRAINKLIRNNDLYRLAVRAKLEAMGIR
jgi:hypothetical protein